MTIELKLTEEEARALLGLLNVANKAAGLEVARACVVFQEKIIAASDLAQSKTELHEESD